MELSERFTIVAVISFIASIVCLFAATLFITPELIHYSLSGFITLFGVTLVCLFVASELQERE